MEALTKGTMLGFLRDIQNQVSLLDRSSDPQGLSGSAKECYFVRKGMYTLAEEIIQRFELAPL